MTASAGLVVVTRGEEGGRRSLKLVLAFCINSTRAQGGVRASTLDVALDLLKRRSCIVWDPGRFRGIAPRRGREEIGEPYGRTLPRPHAMTSPGATQLTDSTLFPHPYFRGGVRTGGWGDGEVLSGSKLELGQIALQKEAPHASWEYIV